MRWLLVGLLARLSLAATANLDIWDIDETCTNYKPGITDVADQSSIEGGTDHTSTLQRAFNVDLAMAEAAVASLEFVLQKRPNRDTSPDDWVKWVRIADSMAAAFGFFPSPDRVNKLSDKYWKNVYVVYDRMSQTLKSSENYPKNGYSKVLKHLPDHKPLIICGQNWQWLDMNQDVPGTETDKSLSYWAKKYKAKGAVGAWYKKGRFVFKLLKKATPIACFNDALAWAWVSMDMITIADKFMTAPGFEKTPSGFKGSKDSIETGRSLQMTGMRSLPGLLFHELIHWYGGLDRNGLVVRDMDAVNDKGEWMYQTILGTQTSTNPPAKESKAHPYWKAAIAYGVENIWNLARTYKSTKYPGPSAAVMNADSFTAFALMMYLDDWFWAEGAKAQPLSVLLERKP